MENAVDALKIAFAVMVFTIALSVAMATFSQARETSEAVLFMNDKTNYYNYDEGGEATVINPGTDLEYTEYEITKTDGSPNITYTDKRIVGIEAIIPTLYRYYKENYTVIFVENDGTTGIPIYDLDSNNEWSKNSTSNHINYFDLNSEITANCPWVGTVNDIKKNLDLFLYGTDNAGYSSGYEFATGSDRKVKYDGFINAHSNATFLEQLGEYSTDRNYGIETDENGDKWLVINGTKYKFDSNTGMVSSTAGELGVIDTKISTFLKSHGMELDIGNNATTQWNEETDWEIIELAKPTIKRVIKYTLIENNP